MIGPGKYDDVCTYARNETEAQGVMLIILGGREGSGFSIQIASPDLIYAVPHILRQVADQIENDLKQKS